MHHGILFDRRLDLTRTGASVSKSVENNLDEQMDVLIGAVNQDDDKKESSRIL